MATKIHIEIDQGSDVNQTIFKVRDWLNQPVDLTGKTATCTAKVSYTALSGYSLGVVLGQNGEVTIQANSAVTSAIPGGRYVYDVVMVDGDQTERLVEGYLAINPQLIISTDPGYLPVYP